MKTDVFCAEWLLIGKLKQVLVFYRIKICQMNLNFQFQVSACFVRTA